MYKIYIKRRRLLPQCDETTPGLTQHENAGTQTLWIRNQKLNTQIEIQFLTKSPYSFFSYFLYNFRYIVEPLA